MKKLLILGKAALVLIFLRVGNLYAQPDDLELRNVSIVSTKSYTAINTITAKENFVVGDGGEVTIGAPSVYLLPDVKVADGGTLYIVSESIALSNDRFFNHLGLKVSQNYPNPFRQQTQIDYQLDKGGELKIWVFDRSGRRIRRLFEGNQIPGTYQLIWEGKDDEGRELSSGMYLIRFQSDHFQYSQKVFKLP